MPKKVKNLNKKTKLLINDLEKQLIENSIKGDQNSFNQLIESEKSKFETFRNYYSRMSQPDFEDCWQKAVLKAFLNLKKFNFKSSFHTWFYIILKNEVLYSFNKYNLNANRETSLSNFYSDVIDLHSIDENTPVTDIIKKENTQRYSNLISHCFSKLHESDKQIIEMALINGMSYKEIGDKLGLSTTSVGTRLFYAKKYAKRAIIKYTNAKHYANL